MRFIRLLFLLMMQANVFAALQEAMIEDLVGDDGLGETIILRFADTESMIISEPSETGGWAIALDNSALSASDVVEIRLGSEAYIVEIELVVGKAPDWAGSAVTFPTPEFFDGKIDSATGPATGTAPIQDKVPPRIQSASSRRSGDDILIDVTFTEPLAQSDAGTSKRPLPTDFVVSVAGSPLDNAGLIIDSLSADGKTVTLSHADCSAGDDMTVQIATGTVTGTDANGNALHRVSTATVVVDGVQPRVLGVAYDQGGNTSGPFREDVDILVTITFDEAMAEPALSLLDDNGDAYDTNWYTVGSFTSADESRQWSATITLQDDFGDPNPEPTLQTVAQEANSVHDTTDLSLEHEVAFAVDTVDPALASNGFRVLRNTDDVTGNSLKAGAYNLEFSFAGSVQQPDLVIKTSAGEAAPLTTDPWSQNGSTWTLPVTITGDDHDAVHALELTFTDAAGNTTTVSTTEMSALQLAIDTTDPVY